MNENNTLINSNVFSARLRERCESFVSETDGRLTMIPIVNRKQLTEVVGRVEFDNFSVDFVYTITTLGISSVKSILSTNIRLDRSNVLAFSIYDLLYLLDENDFSCYIFPYIENIERFDECFDVLEGFIKKNMEKLNELSLDSLMCQKAYSELKKSIGGYLDVNIDEMLRKEEGRELFKLQYSFYYTNHLIKYCTLPYNFYLEGNYDAAIRGYRARRDLLSYEKRLLDHMENASQPYEKTVPNTLNDAMRILSKYGSLSAMAVSFIITMAVLFPVAIGIYYLFAYIGNPGCLYTSAVEPFMMYNSIIGPVFTLSLIGGFVLLKNHSFYVPKKDRKKKMEYDRIMTTEKKRKKFSAFFNVFASIMIVFLMLYSKLGIAFYDNGFTMKFSPLTPNSEFYSYNEIDTYYIVDQYKNEYGQTIKGKTGVIKTTRGEDIIISYISDYAISGNHIESILKDRGVKIERVETLEKPNESNNSNDNSNNTSSSNTSTTSK